jgi:hypothetical protein
VAKTIAKITGTALRPGISKNGRLYTAKQIKSAVERAQARIVAGDSPMTMLTHHLAGDDSVQIVGRVDRVTVGSAGEARYEASLSDTPHGRTIASLADTTDGVPFLKNVSIRGGWLGEVRRVMVDDQAAETGDDLELDGLDFTKSPGVPGADIDSFTWTDAALPTESDGRSLIYESAPAPSLQFTEDAPPEVLEKAAALKSGAAATPQTKASKYADPGYQPDRMKRYALDTVKQAKAAWGYINQAKNAANYTAQQLKRIKTRIKAALTKFGVTVDTKENWLITPARPLTEAVAEYGDVYSDAPRAAFCVNVNNGTVSIDISSYRIDPADLEVCARAAMDGACKALAAMDPDEDGDIDIPGGENDADNMESSPAPMVVENEQDPSQEVETPSVADQPTTPAADAPQPSTPPTAAAAGAPAEPDQVPIAAVPAAGGVHLTDDQFSQLLAKLSPPAAAPVVEKPAELVGAGAPAESAPAPAVAAPVAPVAETTEQMVARLVAEGVKAALPMAVQEAAQAGGAPARKGLVPQSTEAGVAESTDEYPEGWPTDKDTGAPMELHKMPRSAADRLMRPTIEHAVLRGRSVQQSD